MRTHYSSQVGPELEGKEIILAGWVHEFRDLGKVKFLILRDREGLIQLIGKKDFCNEKILEEMDRISKESVIRVKGRVKKSSQAPRGVEIIPSLIEILSPAQSPLPLDVTQKVPAELDTRLDNRFMDLRKANISAIFKLRSRMLDAGRKFLQSRDFIEIYTPKIIASASEGGTELFPISYFDKDAFLAQSPQLYKQMMMATGLDRVFEFTPYFRAEEHDTRRHLNEVTAIDIEMAFIQSEEDVMKILEGLVIEMLKEAKSSPEVKTIGKEIKIPKRIERVDYDEALKMLQKKGKKIPWGEDLDREAERLMGEIVRNKFDSELYFLVRYPLKTRTFYTMPWDEKYSRSFDLEYKGVEICSGAQRIHQYDLLVERMKKKKLNPQNFEFYLKAFKYGMPPHGGFGFGIDRLMMQLLEVGVREVVLFPRDRHRLTP